MEVAKLEIEFLDGNRVLGVKKRPLRNVSLCNDQYMLSEVETLQEIAQIQNFALSLFEENYDFSMKIDELFNDYSDFYRVTDRNSKIVNFARITWQLPGLVLPCMLATRKGSDLHLQLSSPNDVSYGEVFSPFIKSLSTVKTYRGLVDLFYSYGEQKLIDVLFTTYNSTDQNAFNFFSKNFGFRDTGYKLEYGSFGGIWNLIYSTKKSFNETVKLNFQEKNKKNRKKKFLL
jgi:hypothetical protein